MIRISHHSTRPRRHRATCILATVLVKGLAGRKLDKFGQASMIRQIKLVATIIS